VVLLFSAFVFVQLLWRDYRADLLRWRLYLLRRDLYDEAEAAGSLADAEYQRLAQLLESAMQQAAYFTYTQALSARATSHALRHDPDAHAPHARIERDAAAVLAWHITRGSPICWLLFLIEALRRRNRRSLAELPRFFPRLRHGVPLP
jgi:hypothetical protein